MIQKNCKSKSTADDKDIIQQSRILNIRSLSVIYFWFFRLLISGEPSNTITMHFICWIVLGKSFIRGLLTDLIRRSNDFFLFKFWCFAPFCSKENGVLKGVSKLLTCLCQILGGLDQNIGIHNSLLCILK